MRHLWIACFLAVGCSSSSDAPSAQPPIDASLDDSAIADGLVDSSVVDSSVVDSTSIDSSAAETTPSTDAPTDAPTTGKTIVRVHYPAGTHAIALRGSAGPWNWTTGVSMTKGASDTWTIETDAITTDTEWKPLLDDATWSRGPNYHVAPHTTVDVYPHFTQIAGKYSVKWPTFHSAILPNDRSVWVYLPPTAIENPLARFPVVYMHDGQNLFDASTAFGGNEWKVDETMDAAAEDGSIREAIVIGVGNTSARIAEYTPTKDPSEPTGGDGDKYLSLLVTELKPMVDAALPTIPTRESTALVGSSLGGLISAYAGTTKSDTFALIGALSPSTWWSSTVIITDVAATKGKTPQPLRVYVDSGDSGTSSDDMANTKKLAQTYRDVGYIDGKDLDYVLQAGASHSEIYWAQRLPGALQFLLGKGR